MSDWFLGPSAFPSVDPNLIEVGSVLVSPKGTRWSVTAVEQSGRGASYLMWDGRAVRTWRSYQTVRNWTLAESLPDRT